MSALNEDQKESSMETAIDRVMHTYGMIVNMSIEQERTIREKVTSFLRAKPETDEQQLTIAGLRYVRGLSSDAA
jgi:ubiquinone/menaquinone biosynthesis C-methylase UbiE